MERVFRNEDQHVMLLVILGKSVFCRKRHKSELWKLIKNNSVNLQRILGIDGAGIFADRNTPEPPARCDSYS